MIIYNVTINIDDDVHDEWLVWMKEIHMPDVMNTGLFIESRISKVLIEEESGTTYAVQYTAQSMADLEKYQENHAPRLQEDHTRKYGNKFVAFRTLMEVV